MTDVRNELRPLDMLEPSDLWEQAQRREPNPIPEPTPSHGRRAVVIVAVLALAIATTSLAIVALRPGAGGPASGRAPSSNYVVSHIEVHPPGSTRLSHVPPEPGKGTVTFRYAWSNDQYPGVHACALVMQNSGGNEVYRQTFELDSMRPAPSSTFEVIPSSAVAARATISCSPPRLDTPVAYDISNVQVVKEGAQGFAVDYRVTWPPGLGTGGYPATNWCAITVNGPSNATIRRSYSLAVGPGAMRQEFADRNHLFAGVPADELTATVACRPWTGLDAAPSDLTGDALAQQLGLVKHPWPPGTHIDSGPDGVTASDGQDMSDCQPTGPNDVVLVQETSDGTSEAFYCVHGNSQIDAWMLAQRISGHIPTSEEIAQHRNELSRH